MKLDHRIVVLKALVGSHNYNLNTESSDKDYKYFVLPTLDDLYNGTIFLLQKFPILSIIPCMMFASSIICFGKRMSIFWRFCTVKS